MAKQIHKQQNIKTSTRYEVFALPNYFDSLL